MTITLDEYLVSRTIELMALSGSKLSAEEIEDYIYEDTDCAESDVIDAVFNCVAFCIRRQQLDDLVPAAIRVFISESGIDASKVDIVTDAILRSRAEVKERYGPVWRDM